MSEEKRVALVTGGGTGIGAACCRALAADLVGPFDLEESGHHVLGVFEEARAEEVRLVLEAVTQHPEHGHEEEQEPEEHGHPRPLFRPGQPRRDHPAEHEREDDEEEELPGPVPAADVGQLVGEHGPRLSGQKALEQQ